MLEVFNDENFPILYNIYLETYGIDETADKVMDAFNRFYNMQSQYLLHVFSVIWVKKYMKMQLI